jgi:hypothetical protein
MVDRTKLSTHQYAKSQIKWIRKQLLPAVREARAVGGDVQIFVVQGGVAGEPVARDVLARESDTSRRRGWNSHLQVSCHERSYRIPLKLATQMLGCCSRISQRLRQRSPTRRVSSAAIADLNCKADPPTVVRFSTPNDCASRVQLLVGHTPFRDKEWADHLKSKIHKRSATVAGSNYGSDGLRRNTKFATQSREEWIEEMKAKGKRRGWPEINWSPQSRPIQRREGLSPSCTYFT